MRLVVFPPVKELVKVNILEVTFYYKMVCLSYGDVEDVTLE